MKLIILIVVAVLVIGGGVGGFFYWRSISAATPEVTKKSSEKKASSKTPKSDEEEPAPETAETKASKKESDSIKSTLPKDADVKQIVDLQPFIVNLADVEQARYLRMTVSLGLEGEAKEKPDAIFVTRVRNAMLAVLSEKRSEDVLTVEGKAKLRKELLGAAQAASEEPYVVAIYITDFIIQL